MKTVKLISTSVLEINALIKLPKKSLKIRTQFLTESTDFLTGFH